MQISSDNQHIHRLLPSRKVHSSGGNIAQVEKTQHIATTLSGNTHLSPHHNSQQTVYNAVNAISMLQVASESLSEIRGGLRELRTLSNEAANVKNTQNTENFSSLQESADDIVAGIQDILESTKFNGDSLLTENSSHTIMTDKELQNAVTATTYNVDNEFDAAGLYSLNLGELNTAKVIDDSLDAVNLIDIAYDSQQRAFTNTIESVFQQQSNQKAQAAPTAAFILPVEGAQSLSNQTTQDMAVNALSFVQAQANISSEKSINLLTK